MARIAGVDIPDNRRIELGLTMIYGIGPTAASKILKQVRLEGNPKIGDIEDSQLQQIKKMWIKITQLKGDLQREINMKYKTN
jgi:Ribosomal protein S13